MKILSVRFKNLNSLRGEHTVRFDVAPIEGCGLVAITGATGAGKTTILDAITVALYGEIPRYGSGTPRDLMSRHTGECFAEVEFEVKDCKYRSMWSLHRSRRKHDGEFQSTKMEVWDLATDTIISSGSREVPDKIEEITGLDKHRFLRSVMLAQGEFAAFLKAKEGEKSALLEQMTDTKIYSELSKLCFEITKEEKQKLDGILSRINSLELFSDDQKQEIITQKKEQQVIVETLKTELQTLRDDRQWLIGIETLASQKEKNALERQQLAIVIEQSVPQKQLLELHKKAQPFQNDIKELENERKKINELLNEISNYEKQLPEVIIAKENAEQELEKNERVLETLRAEYQSNEELFQNIEEKDKSIAAETLLLKRYTDEVSNEQRGYDNEINKSKDCDNQIEQKYRSLLDSTGKEQIISLLETNLDDREEVVLQQRTLSNQWSKGADVAIRFKENNDVYMSLSKELAELDERIKKGRGILETEQRKLKDCELRLPLLEKALERERLIAKYEQDRATLNENEPCPLCGSTEHPYIEEYHPKLLSEAEKELELEKKIHREANEAVGKFTNGLIKLEQDTLNNQNRTREVNEKLHLFQKEFEAIGIQSLEIVSTDEILEKANLIKYELNTAEDELRIARSLQSLYQTKKNIEENITKLTDSLEHKKEEYAKQNAILAQLHDERTLLFGDKVVKVERELSHKRITNAEQQRDSARRNLEIRKDQFLKLETNLSNAKNQYSNLQEYHKKRNRDLQESTLENGFSTVEEVQAALLDNSVFNRIEAQLNQNEAEYNRLEGVAKAVEEQLTEELLKERTTKTKDELTEIIAEKEKYQTEHEKAIGRFEEQLNRNAKLVEESKQHIEKAKTQEKQYRKWELLDKLIGSSDGAKFSKFAQGLTLARLVQLANLRLQKLNDRYIITHKKDENKFLELEIKDTYQADAIRPIESLSGGESFLVSLALALGLSDLASRRTRIDSLFIDEGFGTLDSNTLDTVISTLEMLHSTGKTIGIISHVEALKERITTQIQVSKSGAGVSKITIIP